MLISAAGCSPHGERTLTTDRVTVVASIYPLADFARQVGGNRVHVITLLPPGASPHVFSPSPRDLTALRDARLFIKIGLGFEFWFNDVVRSGASPAMVEVDTSRGIPLIEETGHSGHGHQSIANPHIWLDPVLAMQQVKRIEEALIGIDPAHRAAYESNAAAYLGELNRLDREIKETVKTIPVKAFIAMHPSWSYFAKRYGLVEAGVIEEAPGREPTPVELARIVQSVRDSSAKVVFSEPQLNPKAAEVLAREIGGVVLELDPVGSPEKRDRSTYLDLMRYNLSILQQGLSGASKPLR
ncbi:MAG: metal ABC transporter substrate-binding protein [bacterium]|nr:metal ABC transporter substrate-binding protein [bacterium]